VRLDLPRHATALRAVYDPTHDKDALKDLLTVLVWYATEGHVNGTNGGVVISQANPDELERVRAAYARICTATGSIDEGAKTDSAWRLYLGSEIIAKLAVHHCGELSENKRLPDFLFGLPTDLLQHAFDELMRTDGTRKASQELRDTASEAYLANFFEYKTTSPMLAAQVGTLATLLGMDYSIYDQEHEGRKTSYRVRYVSGEDKRGGRHHSFQARVRPRAVEDVWVYDIECVGLHNFVCGAGNVVCHNTNEPEYRKLLKNEYMEALRDRTIKIDIPYITKLSEEIKIYEKDYSPAKVRGRHIAPHTLEVAAMWAVLTRLEDPKKHNLSALQKMKLYDGKTLPGYTQDNIKELRKEAVREGMIGISPRYVQDKISNALVTDKTETSINPFIMLNELASGLKGHSLINSEEERKRYRDLLDIVRQEYEDIIKNEVQRAISADEEAIAKLAANYIDHVKAYTQKEKIRNKYTGHYEEPDDRFMRSIEEKIDIADSRKDDFRTEIMNYIGALAIDGKAFRWDTNERLRKALELKLFEDQKDTIKLTSLVSSVLDKETQEKIDIIKQRMIRNYGYNEESATDVLNYVASIFARGDAK
jgi:serine protein kinase